MTGPETQRRWRANCPNCGAPVEFASAASASAVCSFCRSSLLREGEALRKIGESAELFDDYSPLQLGAAGRYAGEAFRLVGRLQLAYQGGSWNEWHALFDSGRSAWLAEDNGSFVLGFEAPLAERAPQAHELILGAQMPLAGQAWRVASLTQVTLAAAQGELPHPPALGRQFLVADLRNPHNEVGTLEYSSQAEAAPLWSVGRPVRLAELAMSGLREDGAKAMASKSYACPSCGADLAPKLQDTKSIVCAQCHAVVDISQGLGADLAHYAQQNGLEPQIPLGSTGSLAVSGGAPLPWQVVGYQERCDLPEPGDEEEEQTFWREYLLYNRTEGFAFLVDTEEGWSVVRPLTGVPKGSGTSVEWQGKSFKLRYSYQAKSSYVLGEFYWRLRREERIKVSDYECKSGSRTELLSREEQAGQEITWSHGRKLDAAEVARAFPKLAHETQTSLARDASPGSAHGLGFKIIVAVLVVLVLLLLVRACSGDDCQSYKDAYGAASSEYQQCRQRSGGSGIRINPGGGSFGGFSSGGGGHK
ncbi:DUF4178 domain-containing protein [Paucibacter soli]|uniref:DUF4178 domain-containing protein n=1 Tax=Paucibacter soli TaxID=3133433 RepID=UPI0030B7871F